ncbi:MAG: hypothetical protein U0K93_02870 [Acutalibacteraceae bacterium]|nr:hypothetical protein [Acutalibacteraceae bacterium]
MKILQEKLDFLLQKYSVEAKATLKDSKVAVIDGVETPNLSHRLERRFIELKNIVQGGTLQGISVMRVARIVEKGADIFTELYRELDICQYILGRKIVAVTAMQNDNTLNVIATTEDSIVCTIEISATLAKGEIPKDKHEIIAQRGIACDVVVDAQLKQESIYVFGAENKKFTDVDFELYGLSIEDIAVVRSAFTIAQKGTKDEMIAIDSNLCTLVEKAKESVATGERQVV